MPNQPGAGRRGHRKSRNGCQQCKLRKVKCDETKPICNNCNGYTQPGSQRCIYNPCPAVKTERPPTAPPTPASTTISGSSLQSSSMTTSSSPAASPAKTHRIALSDILIPVVPFHHLNLRIDALHMRLLHTYSVRTATTMARNPVLQNVWRTQIPELGFTSEYVMQVILAFASLHVAFCHPEEKEQYIGYARHLHEAAVRTATVKLSKVTNDNAPALWSFASLSFFISWAMPPTMDRLWFMSDASGFDGMVIFRGTRTIVESIKLQADIMSSPVGPFFAHGSRQRQLRDSQPPRTHEALLLLQDRITRAVRDADRLKIYTAAVNELNKDFPAFMDVRGSNRDLSETTDVIAWLFDVSDDFLDLLHQQTQESLVIYGHFCLFLKKMGWAWWMNGWCLRQISMIYYRLLDYEHQVWMRWPLEQMGLDL